MAYPVLAQMGFQAVLVSTMLAQSTNYHKEKVLPESWDAGNLTPGEGDVFSLLLKNEQGFGRSRWRGISHKGAETGETRSSQHQKARPGQA